MSKSPDLLDQKSHFAFGKNWASYATLVNEAQIEEAAAGLRRLVGAELSGRRFLDLGCGSGLHSLAALRLGAAEVVALDIDPDSVATTRQLLEAMAPGQNWSVREASVFLVDQEELGRFDVVYSWGVLHHTGDMYRALRIAADLVAPGGQFIFSLYRRTRLCWAWKLEKRWYAKATPQAQARARSVYLRLLKLSMRDEFDGYVANYGTGGGRGMDFYHDVHDLMGGWPYESITATEVERFMQRLELTHVSSFAQPGGSLGLFGSCCDEYVYGRPVS